MEDNVILQGTPVSLLQKSYFDAALDLFDEALVVLDKDYKVVFWSKGAENRLGYTKEDIIGFDIRIIVPDDKMDEYEEELSLVKQGNIIMNKETVRKHKSGNLIDVSLSISPVYDNDNFDGIIGIYKDISKIVELKREAHKYEEIGRLALEGGNFGIWAMDLANGVIQHYNGWKHILGYDDDDLAEDMESYVELIYKDDYAKMREIFKKHLSGSEFVVEYRIKCKDETYKWLRTKGKIYKWNPDGKPRMMIGTNEDITDRKRFEVDLREAYNQMLILKQEAEKANKSKSQFLANISHELRTPLNTIYGILQLVKKDNENLLPDRYINALNEATNTLISLINDLIDTSTIESGTQALKMELFDLRNTVNSIYHNLLIIGNTKGLETSCYIDPSLDFDVIGDELRLKQILTNLITNAVKFTDKGLISLRVTKIESDQNFERVEFKVKDTGIGIQEEFKDKIFDKFSHNDFMYNKRYQGTGLGLMISKQLASLMKGDIEFESEFGQGSTFKFTCELQRAEMSNQDNTIEKSKLKKNEDTMKKTILYIEDNIMSQDIMERIITDYGAAYLCAYHAREALEIMKNNKIDLILMDIRLPEIDGFELIKIIREEYNHIENLPIIAMTAYALKEDKEKCLAAGADDYMAKPFEIEKFYQMLNRFFI